VSFTDLNGFTGVVSNPSSTPSIAIGVSITGIVYGTGALIRAALPADFPTLNQNTTGNAATATTATNATNATTAGSANQLTTPRNINGVAFNGTTNITVGVAAADVTGILAPTNGGTGSAFAMLTGPSGTIKTYTFPNANATVLTSATVVTVPQGGTGKVTNTAGRLLLGAGTSAMTELAPGAIGNIVVSDGTNWTSGPNAAAVGNHNVKVTQGNGYGSTNTKVRRYTNTESNVGTAVTYADSATLGASFTINEDGLYAVGIWDGGAADYIGVSANSAQLTTNIITINAANRVLIGAATASLTGVASTVLRLSAGDVIRPHDNGTMTSTTVYTTGFTIRKVAS